MGKDKKNNPQRVRTLNDSPYLPQESTASLLENSLTLKNSFVRAGTDFALVIQELEADLERIRKKFNDNDGFVERKDLQIDRLVSFFNKVERIVNSYDVLFVQLKIQNVIIENALNGHIMKDADFRREFLNLKY